MKKNKTLRETISIQQAIDWQHFLADVLFDADANKIKK